MNTRPFKRREISIFLLLFLILSSCAGTIKTVKYSSQNLTNYTKAYIVSAENSQYIKFKPGVVTPYVYIALPDDPAETHEVIGNTDIIIKKELEKYGIIVEIGKKGNISAGSDLIVVYKDTWRWDFTKILDRLEIIFISPEGKEIARSVYNITKFKEFHNFPSPKKEVPKMIKKLLDK
jgi:hypothetical protein